ncbi:xaa-Pro dipeptidase [Agrilactobacillus composti DSM 18527 = JCM 14202]|uniref:Xaa-Pro dipeptidase n=1 Tax=Agrilactobacillus composti DSM 18527 = JCM 14202 TaxID=1423734 RepID=X0PV39_9LACO|nr:Xaa-Pro peptidase family protein [Agrilactobacillus composti]KRM32960.1 xaa-Pro dipeptidase [Agrilactobacillus composti DSM 18527 = JCM 14202]GAF42002.1 proline dipeptidase [Agrilactobacillus composti DSM 18527 = JCM 14202]
MDNLDKLRQWTQEQHLDVTYVSDPININYYTHFLSDPHERTLGLFVFPDHDPFIFAPALEVESVKAVGWPYEVFGYLDHENAYEMIADLIKARVKNPMNWAIEKEQLQVSRYEALINYFPEAVFNVNATDFIEHQRLYKTPAEIELMLAAGREADEAFKVGFKAVSSERTEQQVVAEIEYHMMAQGVMHMSFDTIVQSGANAANPHGAPLPDKIKPNALVLFDLGTDHQGYMSDASRTIAYGKIDAKSQDIYNVCLEAQLAAMAAAKPGITAAQLDKVARDIITKAGYGDYFIHRLGHGLGTSVHEFPSIMAGNNMVLEPGMCFSIEPGIYIPEVAGVRIEDCVHITANGCEPFTHTPKTLQTLPL